MRRAADTTAVIGVALLCSIGACSSTVSGQPSRTAAIPATTPAPASSPPTASATKPLPEGSEPRATDQTLVLGTNQLGTHQFNVDGVYDPVLVAQGVVLVLTRKAPSGFELRRWWRKMSNGADRQGRCVVHMHRYRWRPNQDRHSRYRQPEISSEISSARDIVRDIVSPRYRQPAHRDPTATAERAGEFYLRYLPGFRARVPQTLGRSPVECRKGHHPTTWRRDADQPITQWPTDPDKVDHHLADIDHLGALNFGFH
jgi:hypothetical protein